MISLHIVKKVLLKRTATGKEKAGKRVLSAGFFPESGLSIALNSVFVNYKFCLTKQCDNTSLQRAFRAIHRSPYTRSVMSFVPMFMGALQNAKQVRKPWLYRRGGPCALPADQSSYSKEIFGEFVQSANSPNIFSRQYSVLPGGGEPLPYGGDWAMRLFCNSPRHLLVQHRHENAVTIRWLHFHRIKFVTFNILPAVCFAGRRSAPAWIRTLAVHA